MAENIRTATRTVEMQDAPPLCDRCYGDYILLGGEPVCGTCGKPQSEKLLTNFSMAPTWNPVQGTAPAPVLTPAQKQAAWESEGKARGWLPEAPPPVLATAITLTPAPVPTTAASAEPAASSAPASTAAALAPVGVTPAPVGEQRQPHTGKRR